jgi:heme oxygenase
MLMATLREETRSYHDRIERSPLLRGMLGAELSHRYYAAVLGVCYGFCVPLEARLLEASDWAALDFDLNARLKTPLLEEDLAAFGLEGELLHALPHCAAIPPIPDLPTALGALYVIEGATLGGQLIARQIASTLGLGPRSGAAFYNSYCGQVGPMWRSFKSFVEQHGAGHEAAVVAAAAATFAALEAWYNESYRAIAGARLIMPQYQYALAD